MHLLNALSVLLALGTEVTAKHVQLPATPSIQIGPKSLEGFRYPSGKINKNRVCVVPSGKNDTAADILAAAKKCNDGGTVYFPEGDYVIRTSLDLNFLKKIDFIIEGTISFADDIESWSKQVFRYPFQSANFFWRWGGNDVNIYGLGKGTIDGRGQTYWTAMKVDPDVNRPILFGTDGLHRATISGLNFKNPPNWFSLFTNSSDILISDMNLEVKVTNASSPAKNTDGFDTYRSSNIVIQRSHVVNTDDCVSFKPNSSSVLVQNLDCTGSHGVSVGSLGQYQGEVDIVEDVYVYNVSFFSSTDAARIKVWPGVAPGTVGSTAGGGSGRVENITYDTIHATNNDQILALTQCYTLKNQADCDANPSDLTIRGVLSKHISGVTSKKYDPNAGSLVCSSPTVCSDITAEDINITVPSGKNATFTCTNLDESKLAINCA